MGQWNHAVTRRGYSKITKPTLGAEERSPPHFLKVQYVCLVLCAVLKVIGQIKDRTASSTVLNTSNPPSGQHQGQGLLHFQYGTSLLYPLQGKNVESSQGRRGGRRKA